MTTTTLFRDLTITVTDLLDRYRVKWDYKRPSHTMLVRVCGDEIWSSLNADGSRTYIGQIVAPRKGGR